MRAPVHHRSASSRVNMTPMIDVVFLLIIFFLVSSHLARQENRPSVELPTAGTAAPSDPATSPLNLTINARGRLQVGGRVCSIDQLPDELNRWQMAQSNSRQPSTAIRLRVDQSAPFSFAEPVLLAIAQAGFDDVSLATLAERP